MFDNKQVSQEPFAKVIAAVLDHNKTLGYLLTTYTDVLAHSNDEVLWTIRRLCNEVDGQPTEECKSLIRELEDLSVQIMRVKFAGQRCGNSVVTPQN